MEAPSVNQKAADRDERSLSFHILCEAVVLNDTTELMYLNWDHPFLVKCIA